MEQFAGLETWRVLGGTAVGELGGSLEGRRGDGPWDAVLLVGQITNQVSTGS